MAEGFCLKGCERQRRLLLREPNEIELTGEWRLVGRVGKECFGQRHEGYSIVVSRLTPFERNHIMFAALGIILIVAGAIITFAIEREADGVDIRAIGWIMIAGGGLALLVAIIQGAGWMSSRRTAFHSERHVSTDGRHVVEESEAL